MPFDYTQSTPVYDDARGFVLSFRGGTILLDTCQGGGSPCTWWSASSEELWLNAAFDHVLNTWQITDAKGVTYTYGGDANARIGSNVNAATGTFGWYLSAVRETNGNTIAISYLSTVASGANAYAYPKQVDYDGNSDSTTGFTHVFHAALGYDEAPSGPRADVVTTYRGGFAETAAKRLTSISVWVGDGASIPANPTRKYQLFYQQHPDTGLSLLTSVTEAVTGGISPPPATTFSYQFIPAQCARVEGGCAADLYQRQSV